MFSFVEKIENNVFFSIKWKNSYFASYKCLKYFSENKYTGNKAI